MKSVVKNFLVDILNIYLEVDNFIIAFFNSIITAHGVSFYFILLLVSCNKFSLLKHIIWMKEVSGIGSSLHFRDQIFIIYFYVLMSTWTSTIVLEKENLEIFYTTLLKCYIYEVISVINLYLKRRIKTIFFQKEIKHFQMLSDIKHLLEQLNCILYR